MERDAGDLFFLLNGILESYVMNHQAILKDTNKTPENITLSEVCEKLGIRLSTNLIVGYLTPKNYIEQVGNSEVYKATDYGKKFWNDGKILDKFNV